jgi:hypothetical protein
LDVLLFLFFNDAAVAEKSSPTLVTLVALGLSRETVAVHALAFDRRLLRLLLLLKVFSKVDLGHLQTFFECLGLDSVGLG